MYFSHICHFRSMTQPTKTQIFDPFPTQPNPTQPAGQPNPWTTLEYFKLEFGMYPQSMPTEWTHARTLRPWQSVRLDL